MVDTGLGSSGTNLRARLRDKARRRVLNWVYGAETTFPGDPRRRLIADHTVTADVRLVQYHANDGDPVTVGKYTGITHTAVMLHGGLHRADWVSVVHAHRDADGAWTWPEGAMHSKGPIEIGSDVLITYEALIMSGVKIGHGAIVAPRAVVTKDVEPYEIVGGNPARHIKYRFDEPTREALLRIAWWDWPEEKVSRLRHEIDSPDVAGFVARHDPLLHGGRERAPEGEA
ncbi:MAG TPA: CatB-related O-acetyltransferase [Jatrophihabitantaceae bacterium]|nr:CatB-related O-acetyltransferase [Jatrophihabitantaceae bacterium]